MKFIKVLRSALALLLILASVISMVPTAFGAETSEDRKITIDADAISTAVEEAFPDGTPEEDEAAQAAYEEALVNSLSEQYGLDFSEEEDREFGTWENVADLYSDEKAPTKDDAVGTSYVFYDFRPGGTSRNIKWQVNSDDGTEPYMSETYSGALAADYLGTNAYLYMPVQSSFLTKMGSYVLKSGDICRIQIRNINENTQFPKTGTATAESYLAVHASGNMTERQKFGSNQKITMVSEKQQTLTWTVTSSLVGQTLYGVRWDPSQTELTVATRIYIDYIYIGPKASAPVLVEFRNEANTGNLSNGGCLYTGYGKKAPSFSTGKTNSETTTTQTIWGWQVLEYQNGAWKDINKFTTDPASHTCRYNTRFVLKQVTIRKEKLASTQTYVTGDPNDDKYVLSVDGFDTAEMSIGSYGSALDVTIVLDRSGSQAQIVGNTQNCKTYDQVVEKLEKLDKTAQDGYYRVTCWRRNHSDGSSGVGKYLYTMPMRYHRGKWQMQYVKNSCDCNGTSHCSYGIYTWNSTGLTQCSHVVWTDMETGFNLFKKYAEAAGYTMGSSSCYFTFGASRLGRCQNALVAFMSKLYNSSPNLKPGTNHRVSIVSFGDTVFAANYPYYDGNSKYKTANNYGDASLTLKDVVLNGYENVIISTIRDSYVFGSTRTDCAMQVLTGTRSAIEKSAGKSTATLTKTNYIPAAASGRKRIVILMTDGSPSSSVDFDTTVATAAIVAAKSLKSNSSTFIYALGIMDGLNDAKYYGELSGDHKNANNFMNLVSSRYPNATAYNEKGDKKVTGPYFIADTSAGSKLSDHMNSIWNDNPATVASSSLTGPGSLWLKEKFSREWKPDSAQKLKVYAQPYTSNGTYGSKVLIGEHAITLPAAGSKTTITGNGYTLYVESYADQSFSYTLKWTDAKKSYLRETSFNLGSAAKPVSGTMDISKGYKIVMEMPIEVDRNNTLGGNNIPLTTSESGCYQASNSGDTDMGTKLYSYNIPNANVFCSVEADPHDYFISMEEYAALMNSTATNKLETILDAMFRMPDDLKPQNDNKLSNLDYVQFDVQLKNSAGTVMLRRAATYGATSFSSYIDNVLDTMADLSKDQTFTMVSSMQFKTHNKDSFGREAYPDVNATYTPTYYVPKFAVVDYDGNIAVDLGSVEGADATKITASSGSTFADGKLTCSVPAFMTGSDNAVTYTYNTKYAPKGSTSTSVERKVYLVPGNVITYDDSRIGFETGWSDSGTKTVLTQSFDNQAFHGYDASYASTGNYHGSTKVATVDSKNSTAYGYFTFTGTGVEIVSRCAPDSGVLLAEIYSGTECIKDNLKKSILCNTYLNTATYEQSPIIRWEGEFGTYTVRLTAYYNVAFAIQKSKNDMTEEEVRGILGYDDSIDFTYIPSEAIPTRAIRPSYNTYVDAVRIFNSAGTSETVKYAYSLSGEPVVADFTDLRSQIIDVGNWKGADATGMLYIADTKETAGSGSTTQDTIEGFPLLMDDTVNIETVEVIGAFGTKEKRTYYLDSNDVRIKDPQTGNEIWSMKTDDGYWYCVMDPNGTAAKPYKTLSRTYVRSVLGTEFVYYNSSYYSYGPKFEIYLSKGNGVAFTAVGDRVYLSLRSIDGKPCSVEVYNGAKWVPVLSDLTSKTEQFFDFTTYKGNVILKNTGEGILSIAQAKTIGIVKGVRVNKQVAFAAMKAFETPADKVEMEELKLGHSLNLQSNISINYMVSKAVLEQYDSYELCCEVQGRTYTLFGEEKGEYIYFTLDCLTAAMMNDNVRAVLTAYKGDEVYVSETDDYSIAAYAFTMMNREGMPEQVKSLCANLLRYGAATQTYLGYNTDALADEEMTMEHRAYLRDLETVTFGAPYTIANDVSDPKVTWFGRTLSLDSTVAIRLAVNASGYAGAAEELELRVSFTGIDGEEKTLTVQPEVYNAAGGLYLFTIDGLNAAELRCELSCQVFAGDEAVSQTMTYSADSYGNGKTGTLLELCKALFAYVDEARAFFAN